VGVGGGVVCMPAVGKVGRWVSGRAACMVAHIEFEMAVHGTADRD
jgi:hypothetical protein